MIRTMTRPMALAASLGLALSSCGSDDATQLGVPSGGSGSGGSGGLGGSGGTSSEPEPPPCVENPVTHLEIINACTSSLGIWKTPQLTLLEPDGSLPPP